MSKELDGHALLTVRPYFVVKLLSFREPIWSFGSGSGLWESAIHFMLLSLLCTADFGTIEKGMY